MKTITIERDELFAVVSDGEEIPTTLTVKGLSMTAEQWQAMCGQTRSGVVLTIQKADKAEPAKLAMRTDHFPGHAPWALYEPDGTMTFQGLDEFMASWRAQQ